jgi:multidrug efflux pump subunit AcrA (membrane-fusion protein)
MIPVTNDLEPTIPQPIGLARAKPAQAGTGVRIVRITAVIVVALGVGFFLVHRAKNAAEARLADATSSEAMEAPVVNVFTVTPSPGTQSLKMPGETAAWNETAIYARVNGYVAKWYADIGDNVIAGQTLALIDTPELDAELLAARAKLNATIAQVAVKKAQAEFAMTTDQRWRESPKGVVSDQERESKKASSAEAAAELNAAEAQVMLQRADVDRLTALTQFK